MIPATLVALQCPTDPGTFSARAATLPLQSLFNGGALSFPGVTVGDFAITQDETVGVSPDFSQVNVTATIEAGSRLVLDFDFADQFATSGTFFDQDLNLLLSYTVTLDAPYEAFTGFTTRLIDAEVVNPTPSQPGGLVLAQPAVFNSNLAPIFAPIDGVFIDKNPFFAGEERLLSSPVFNASGSVTVETLYSLFGDEADHQIELRRLTQEFDLTVVPEPGTLAIVGGLTVLMGRRRR